MLSGRYSYGDGGQSINNEMRIILPEPEGFQSMWSLKNGLAPQGPIKVPVPVGTPSIPLTQTGQPAKEPK